MTSHCYSGDLHLLIWPPYQNMNYCSWLLLMTQEKWLAELQHIVLTNILVRWLIVMALFVCMEWSTCPWKYLCLSFQLSPGKNLNLSFFFFFFQDGFSDVLVSFCWKWRGGVDPLTSCSWIKFSVDDITFWGFALLCSIVLSDEGGWTSGNNTPNPTNPTQQTIYEQRIPPRKNIVWA